MIYKKKIIFGISIIFIGALVSKPILYKTRSWEFLTIDSVDVTDSYQSNISLYIRGNEVYRIQPRSDRFNTNNWLADKSRYLVDSFSINRIFFPAIFIKGVYEYSNLTLLYKMFQILINIRNTVMYIGSTCSFEDFSTFCKFQRRLGINSLYYNYYHTHENNISPYELYSEIQKKPFKSNFLFNFSMEDMQQYDAFIFLNNKIRYTMPIIYNKLKNFSQQLDIECIFLGNYSRTNIGLNNFIDIKDIILGKHHLSKFIMLYTKLYIFLEKQDNIYIYLKNLICFTNYMNSLQQKTIKSTHIISECGALVKQYGEI